jgi:hypothetical protein
MQRWILVVTVFLSLGSGYARAGERQQLRLKWEELDSRILHKKTAFGLPDGTRLEGKVLGVEETGLHLHVTKTSNRREHRKGDQLIARDAISVLRVTEYGKKGRILGTLGVAALAGGIVAAQHIEVYEGPALIIIPAVIALGIGGSAIGGYYAGKAYDKKVTEISIVR